MINIKSKAAMIFSIEVAVVLILSNINVSCGFITFPAATAALRKIPGFESASLSAPADANALLEQISNAPAIIQNDLSNFASTLFQQASITAKSVSIPALSQLSPSPEVTNALLAIQNVANQIVAKIGSYENGVYFGYAVIGFLSLSVLTAILKIGKNDGESLSEPYGTSGRYSPGIAAEYFSSRPLLVFNRGFEIAVVASLYAFGLLIDLITGKLTDPRQEEKRADQLTEVLTRLGPTFIKVWQSLSIRTDLLRPAYIKGVKSVFFKAFFILFSSLLSLHGLINRSHRCRSLISQ